MSFKVTNIEGLINQWINSATFDGEVTFQFTCPMTRRPASVLKDQGDIRATDPRFHYY